MVCVTSIKLFQISLWVAYVSHRLTQKNINRGVIHGYAFNHYGYHRPEHAAELDHATRKLTDIKF